MHCRPRCDHGRLRIRSRHAGSDPKGPKVPFHGTDINWSCDTGPDVSGPAESLLMALAGCRAAVADLPGQDATSAFATSKGRSR